MFICDFCNAVVPPRTKVHRVIIETRPRRYPRRIDANPVSRNRRSTRTDDPGGEGFEAVKEATVCPGCADTSASTAG